MKNTFNAFPNAADSDQFVSQILEIATDPTAKTGIVHKITMLFAAFVPTTSLNSGFAPGFPTIRFWTMYLIPVIYKNENDCQKIGNGYTCHGNVLLKRLVSTFILGAFPLFVK